MAEHEDRTNGQRDIRHELVEVLLDKVRNDPYPSTTMMDMVEELLGPDERGEYANALMDKIHADQFPSLDLMARVRNLT